MDFIGFVRLLFGAVRLKRGDGLGQRILELGIAFAGSDPDHVFGCVDEDQIEKALVIGAFEADPKIKIRPPVFQRPNGACAIGCRDDVERRLTGYSAGSSRILSLKSSRLPT